MSNDSQHEIGKVKLTKFSFGVDLGNFTLGNINDYTVNSDTIPTFLDKDLEFVAKYIHGC